MYVCRHSFILDVRFVDVPAGVTQEEGHTGFLHLPSAVLALIYLARRIQPFFSLVDREVEFYVLTNQSFSTCWAFFFFFFWRRKIPVRVTSPRFELTSQRQKVSRLPTEPPGRPVTVYQVLCTDSVKQTYSGMWAGRTGDSTN